jgi:hypothetical protein
MVWSTAMSRTARKSGDRLSNLRVRVENTIAAWDDKVLEVNCVFVPTDDVVGFVDKVDQAVEFAGLDKLEHQYLDGGVLVRFRRKHDADVFRRLIREVTPM